MLLIYGDESRYAEVSEEEGQADMQRWFDYTNDLQQAGVMEAGEALQPTSTATSVRDDGGKPLVTDGPFAETREQLGGYYVFNVPNLDDAIKWAHKCPGIAYGTMELRPIMEIPAT
jgi:hypothetical protein